MKTELVRKHFNKAHTKYDDACSLQLQTGNHLIYLLKKQQQEYVSMLDAGCGTGIVTQTLASNFNFKNLYAIDIADNLIALAKEKLCANNILVSQTNFNEIAQLNVKFDCIFANLALHWSDNLKETLSRFKNHLTPHGLIAFAIPINNTFLEIKTICSVQDFLQSDDITSLAEGYEIVASETQDIVFNFTNLREALLSIKAVGANFVSKRKKSLALRQAIRADYPTQLTYQIGYFIFKRS